MISEELRKVADAVLFEGYMLYPYRASALKNRQRWNFGTLYPRDFAQMSVPEENWSCRAEMIVEGGTHSRVDICVRFLQLIPEASDQGETWERGAVRYAEMNGISLDSLCEGITKDFAHTDLAYEASLDALPNTAGYALLARMELRAEPLSPGYWRIGVTLLNETRSSRIASASYETVRPLALTSAHLMLHTESGAFVSLLDPPDSMASATAACNNRGLFPVLVGAAGNRADMLCSPIILYDYPAIAAESAGDFFDGTEMDEMLSLRVMTLSDEEKQEMRSGDPLARKILERTESMPEEYLLKLHGVIRGMSAAKADESEVDGRMEPWNPFDDKPAPESVVICGVELRKGGRVRLRPSKRADILDLALSGRVAIIEAIEQDFEDNVQFAVVLEDDPGSDLGLLRQPGHRFFFGVEEVEPLRQEAT